MTTFQVMPALDAEQLAALETDIAARGVLVPVVVDQNGRVLDGHHRRAVAHRLGLECPTEVRHVADDEEARDVAYALNLARRHLTREQRRELITQECQQRPEDSDRAVARRLGCSPSTVAAVRRPVSNLDTDPAMPREEAEALTQQIDQGLQHLDGLLEQLPPALAARALMTWWRTFEAAHDGDENFLGPVRRHVVEPRLDALLAVTG